MKCKTPTNHQHQFLPRGLFCLAAVLCLELGLAACGAKEDKISLGYAGKKDAAAADAATSTNETRADANAGASGSAKNSETSGQKPMMPVTTVPVEVAQKEDAVKLSGSLEADEEAEVASNAEGIVEKIFVDRGSHVKEGDPLIQIDPTDARNTLAEGEAAVAEVRSRLDLSGGGKFEPENQPEVRTARANYELAEKNFNRYSELQKEGIISKAEYDRSEAEYKAARERLNQVRNEIKSLYRQYQTGQTKLTALNKKVKDRLIRAPFEGIVAEKMVSLGERVEPMMGGGKVVKLVKINPLRLRLTVPQQHASLVREEQTVNFEVDGLPEKTFSGKIVFIGPSLERETRSLTVEAVVDNSGNELRPGMFATARMDLGTKKPAYYVPETAVQREADVARLFVVQDGVARERVVALGEAAGGMVEVTAGLSEHERVVGQAGDVRDGVRVQ